MQAKGALAQIIMDFEAVYGANPGAPNGRRMPFVSTTMKASQALNDDEIIRASRSPAPPTAGNIDASGNIVVPIDKRAIGYWLTAMFGNPVTTGAADLYTHVWKLGDSQPSFLLEKGFTDINQYFLYNGCKVGKAAFSFGGDGAQRMTLDLQGAKETIAAASYDATPLDTVLDYFNSFHLSMKEGGANIAYIKEASLDLDFGLDADQFPIGSAGVRTNILEGIVNPTGSLNAFFMDAVLLNKAVQGTETSLEWKWVAGSHSLEFVLQEVLLERNSPEISGRGGVSVSLNYRGYHQNHADGSAVKVTLVNDVASYAM